MILLGDSIARRRGFGGLCVLILLDVVDLQLLRKLRVTAVSADGDYRSCAEVVLDADGAVGEVEVFLHDGKARPYAADVAFHGFDGGGESGQLCTVFASDARPLVCETDGAAVIEDGYRGLLESRVYEVLRNLADNRIGNGAARRLRLLVYVRCQAFDELAGGGGLDFGDTRRAQQVVV